MMEAVSSQLPRRLLERLHAKSDQARLHLRSAGEQPDHGCPATVAVDEMLEQVQESPAFSIDRSSRAGMGVEGIACSGPGGECREVELWVAAREVDGVGYGDLVGKR